MEQSTAVGQACTILWFVFCFTRVVDYSLNLQTKTERIAHLVSMSTISLFILSLLKHLLFIPGTGSGTKAAFLILVFQYTSENAVLTAQHLKCSHILLSLVFKPVSSGTYYSTFYLSITFLVCEIFQCVVVNFKNKLYSTVFNFCQHMLLMDGLEVNH